MTESIGHSGEPGAIPPETVSAMSQGIEVFVAGGPVIVILTCFSIVALALTLVKLWQFHAVCVGDTKPARQAIKLFRADRVRDAMTIAGQSPNPVAQAVERAVRGRHFGLPDATVREEVLRFGEERLESLRSYLRSLEVIAALAPLLGLLGTVIGMIEAFKQLQAAGAQVDPAALSGGIWEALLTTAVGLAVAIPVVAIHAWLDRVVERLGHDMESIVTQVFTVDLSSGLKGKTAEAPSNLSGSYAIGG